MTEGRPPGWTQAALSDLVTVLDKMRVPLNKTERSKRRGTVPYYGATGQVDCVDGALFDEELLLLGEDGAPFLDPSKPKSYIIGGPSWVNNHAHVLRAENGLTSNLYLKHYLDFVDYRPHVTGTTRLKLTQRAMRSIPVSLPSVTEQERIVTAVEEHFSRLDATDTALAAAQRRLDALRRSAAAELFDRPDWTWTTLSEIAELKGGVSKDSKREADPEYVEYPYLRVANVQRGFLDLSVVTTIRADRHKAKKLVLEHGDILLNEGGDRDKLGRGWVWEGQIENCIHQNHVFRARLTGGDFDPYFVSMHANTWGQQWFETHGKQTTNLASINLTTLKSFPVPAPSLEDQQAVVAELQSIAGAEHRLQADLDRAQGRSRTLRRSILAKAFTGQLVPQDPTDESASVLLDCIAASRATKPNRRASARQMS